MTARVLVVDDVELNVKLLAAKLAGEYFESVSADNGPRALEIAEAELPDIILLDVMMPRMDGFEVCRRLKANAQTADIPVVMVTALSDVADRLRGLEAGADDLKDDGSGWYIVTPPEALEKVKEALTKAGITPTSAEISMVPQNYIKLTGAQATQMVRLIEALEEHDDVQHVYANFDIDESEIQAAVGAN